MYCMMMMKNHPDFVLIRKREFASKEVEGESEIFLMAK